MWNKNLNIVCHADDVSFINNSEDNVQILLLHLTSRLINITQKCLVVNKIPLCRKLKVNGKITEK